MANISGENVFEADAQRDSEGSILYGVYNVKYMENIPQSSDSPYEVGDKVRIYLGEDDVDSQYHGLVCEIIGDRPDDLGKATGREVDSHHYRLRRVDTGEELPLAFRHEDLVPKSEWPVRE